MIHIFPSFLIQSPFIRGFLIFLLALFYPLSRIEAKSLPRSKDSFLYEKAVDEYARTLGALDIDEEKDPEKRLVLIVELLIRSISALEKRLSFLEKNAFLSEKKSTPTKKTATLARSHRVKKKFFAPSHGSKKRKKNPKSKRLFKS